MTVKELKDKLEVYPDETTVAKLKDFYTIEIEEVYSDTIEGEQYVIVM